MQTLHTGINMSLHTKKRITNIMKNMPSDHYTIVHAMTEQLSCHVHSFVMIIAIEFGWEHYDISHKFDLQCGALSMANFLKNPPNRHPIARQLGGGMGFLLWVQTLTISIVLYTVSCYIRGRFKNAYELLNLRVLKISMLYKNHIIQCMSKIFCVEFQRVPLKFHTKYFTHTLKDVDSIHRWKFKSS